MPGFPEGLFAEGKISQIAFVVDDIEKAALHWATTHKAGPFFVYDPIVLDGVIGPDGQPAIFEHGIAIGQWGTIQVELMRNYRVTPESAAEVMLKPGFNHVAYFAPDSEAERDRLTRLGAPLMLGIKFAGITVSLHDARAMSGFVIEHYPHIDAIEENFRRVAEAARGWDGRDPIRML